MPLKVRDFNICSTRGVEEYGNPLPSTFARRWSRNGERSRRPEAENQCSELRALQDMQHLGPVPDH